MLLWSFDELNEMKVNRCCNSLEKLSDKLLVVDAGADGGGGGLPH